VRIVTRSYLASFEPSARFAGASTVLMPGSGYPGGGRVFGRPAGFYWVGGPVQLRGAIRLARPYWRFWGADRAAATRLEDHEAVALALVLGEVLCSYEPDAKIWVVAP
jgi:hypothetical protein